MDKAYQHLETEDQIYQSWEDAGCFLANAHSEKPPFTIPLPPPNVTGNLHLGHAAMLAIEDIMIRYKKMRGHEVLWVPGTDHAAIATENVVIKHHGKKSREEWPSREAFLSDCRAFATEKHDNIVNQMKKMGSWLDWSREAYTFDEARNHGVNAIFKQLFEDGLIERGHRLINWSTGAQSVISDDELEWEEVKEPFYYIKCGKFVMGTVRPETKCADSPLVVHPEEDYVEIKSNNLTENLIIIKRLFNDQERFFKTLNFLDPEAHYEIVNTKPGKDFVGEEFTAETYAGMRNFYVIADEVIDPEKGSGAMTISASHSADDYDLAKRLGLDKTFIQKIDFAGNMTDIAGPVAGMHVKKARNASGKLLAEKGLLLGKDTNYNHRVPLCYRSNCVVEPMISPQWFVMVEKEYSHPVDGKTTLKAQMQAAVRENHVKIIPERFEKTYFHWIDNLQDWCISRQIWWGHRIPVWYDESGNTYLPEEKEIIFVRHGESEGNRHKKIQSLEDPLTDDGRAHAKAMIEVLKHEGVSTIITGTSARNRETAQIIADGLGVKITEIPELGAYDPKEVGGRPVEEIGTAIKYCKDNNCGESFDAFVSRLEVGMKKMQNVQTNGKIIFVTNRSTYSVLQTLREGRDTTSIFERRSKNSHLPHGIIDRWQFFQAPEKEGLTQDEDTLDTWFSSALWPFSTLGWPNANHPDFQKFYPTDVLETGWDILFFWVARMIMFGRYATGKYPYHTVYLHGLVTDEHGKKMSKSKGNGIDPLDMITKFGADPVRLALVIGSSPGNPIPIGENKIKGYRNFVNKLWNAGRFIQMQGDENICLTNETPVANTVTDQWILSRLSNTIETVTNALEKYDISLAGDVIYHFVWDEFCDWYLEASKVEPNPAVLNFVYLNILKLVHPLCPFVTEQIWKQCFGADSFITEQEFPELNMTNPAAEAQFNQIQNITNAIRKVRAEKQLNPKNKINVSIKGENISEAAVIKFLANLSDLEISQTKTKPDNATTVILDHLEIFIQVPFDVDAETTRLKKSIEELTKKITNLEGRLSNESYTTKAPQALVNQTKEDLARAKSEISKLQSELNAL